LLVPNINFTLFQITDKARGTNKYKEIQPEIAGINVFSHILIAVAAAPP
jgi:hypothetical protein